MFSLSLCIFKMIYIFETKLLETKSIFYSLNSIHGIGKKQSSQICNKLGFSKNLKIKQLSKEQVRQLIKVIDSSNLIINKDLKKLNSLITKNLVNLKSYRGLRKIKGLPVRGQRTHTNAQTVKKRKWL